MKKRWKDIKLRVKKKEAARKQGQRKTGGGPPPNVEFKPWEIEVLTLIPEESIVGLEGAVDTDLDTSCAEKPVDSTGQQSQESIVDPFIVYEVDIAAETLEPGPSETLTAEDTSCASQHARPRGKPAPKKKTNTEDEAVMSLVEVKRQRNAVEIALWLTLTTRPPSLSGTLWSIAMLWSLKQVSISREHFRGENGKNPPDL